MADLTQSLSKASQMYSELTTLRAAITAIPFVGGSIDVLISGKAQNIAQKRLETLAGSLKDELNQLKGNQIDKNFLESDEWFDLLMQTFDKTIRTRSEEKIRLFSKVLTGVLASTSKRDTAEEFLNILSELSETEIAIAHIVYELQTVNIKQLEEKNPFIAKCDFVDQADLPFYLKRLEKAGLVSEEMGMIVGYEGGIYHITPTFKKLMGIINH